jgi:hypothetical protein
LNPEALDSGVPLDYPWFRVWVLCSLRANGDLTMTRFDSSSFFRGFGRVLDLGGATTPTYARRARWHRDDAAAIASDWRAVWGDLGQAYGRVRQRDQGQG